jgi:glycosyltransferase involved in cell wall biosynthesis
MLNVSVVVVCYNERTNIERCLSALINQTYPSQCYEILCVDNGSDDGSRDIIQRFENQYGFVRFILNPVKGIAGSRNLGVKNARYDLIAFIDADCVAPPHWLQNLVAGYQKYHALDPHVVAVGGSNVPPAHSLRFYDVLNVFLNTYLGSHSSVQGRRFDVDRPVKHIPTVNTLIDKQRLMEVSAFDITFGNIGEDQDLSYRFQEKNFYYYYLKDAQVTHFLRPTLGKWNKNMFTYGKGRMWLYRKHKRKIKLTLLLPFLLIPFLLTLFFSGYSPLFYAPLFYFAIIFLVSVIECARAGKINFVFDLFLLYISTHIAYGCGQWYGLLKNREKYRLKTQAHLQCGN